MRSWKIAVVLLSGCVVNGKPYGSGSTTPSSTPPSSAPPPSQASSSAAPPTAPDDRSDLYTADGRVREDARYYKEPPYLSAPADPWAAVTGDQPLRWTAEAAGHWTIRANESPCTAREDHCLVKDTWFFVRQSDLDRHAQYKAARVQAAVGVFGPDGPARPWNARSSVHGDNLTAYRTVPATRKNLVRGAIVIGLTRESTLPRTGIGALEASWVYGIVEDVNIDLGTYQLEDFNDTLPLEGARVAVLFWKQGGTVQIIGGKPRDQLAVSANDVFAPK